MQEVRWCLAIEGSRISISASSSSRRGSKVPNAETIAANLLVTRKVDALELWVVRSVQPRSTEVDQHRSDKMALALSRTTACSRTPPGRSGSTDLCAALGRSENRELHSTRPGEPPAQECQSTSTL